MITPKSLLLQVNELKELLEHLNLWELSEARKKVSYWIKLAGTPASDPITKDEIIQIFCQKYNCTPDDLAKVNKPKTHYSTQRRFLAVMLMRYTKASREEIYLSCGYKYNASINYALDKTASDIKLYPELRAEFNELEQMISELKNHISNPKEVLYENK